MTTINITTKNTKKIRECLKTKYDSKHLFEIGVDECARGPMFGRLYVASVVLDESFDHSKMCDSKKIHSPKKFLELSTYIKENAVAWNIDFIEPWTIDEINIRQAVLLGMTKSITATVDQLIPHVTEQNTTLGDSCFVMVDGNDYKEYIYEPTHTVIPHITVEKGDNTYSCIAAASILAKHAHDQYILDLCKTHPELSEKYALDENMGYGTKKHMEGIMKHGITKWHRKTFGICKVAKSIDHSVVSPIL